MDKLPILIKRAKVVYAWYDKKELLFCGEMDALLLAEEVLKFAESITGESYIPSEGVIL